MDKPMLAVPSTGSSGRPTYRVEDLLAKGWILDLKLDGERCWARHGRLINRNGVDITDLFPDVTAPKNHWFDGEIVALNGSFESVLVRSSQPRYRASVAKKHPCKFVAFDLPSGPTLPYLRRRRALERIAAVTGVATTLIGDDLAFVEKVKALGLEGVIAKNPRSPYRFGKRSNEWVKFKNTQRISMVAIGYNPGQGSRAHFGALKLALVGPDGPVTGPEDGWRVGSGFTERDTHMLKERIDAGDLLVVEVELLNRTKDNALRFPVYKGIRTDVEPIDCTIDQLEALPTC